MGPEHAVSLHGRETGRILARAQELVRFRLEEISSQTDRRFAVLTLVEWAALVCAAVWISPRTSVKEIWLAAFLGGMSAALPLALAWFQPGRVLTRHVIAASQMVMAGLLVQVTSARFETHFCYFGLLAFLAFYRDWRVLVTAMAVAAADHFVRALVWPESMYGSLPVSLLRPLEHVGWFCFVGAILTDSITKSSKALFGSFRREAQLENVSEQIAFEVRSRTAELAESEQRYRVIFESSPLPMWLCDANSLMFLAVNQQASRKYGYLPEEFLSMRVPEIEISRNDDDDEGFPGNVLGSAVVGVRRRHHRKDGTVMDVEVTMHPIEWAGRTALLMLSIDTSDRMRAEREKDSMEVQLRHAQRLESIGQLAAGIAHEINTPTQYIGDNLHFLRDAFGDVRVVLEAQERVLPLMEAEPPLREAAVEVRQAMRSADVPYLMDEIPKALEQALDGVNRVSTLVKAMKEFSHPGAKEKTPADLNSAILSTITVARNEWKYVAKMETDLDPNLPLVSCMVSDFNQVVLNLIVNAAHAIAATAASGLGTITITTRIKGDHVEVRVKDTGTGIPFQVRDRIFDPFFTTKEVGKGTGQGLAIARSVVVDKHCGILNFETEMGRGTTFIVRLPISGTSPGEAAEPPRDRAEMLETSVT